MQVRSRGRGALGGGEEEVGLGHLCSYSLVSLKYHHSTCLLGKCLLVLQHSSTHKAFITLLFARPQCSPFCLQVIPLQTLITASTTLFHTYLFAHHYNNAHNVYCPSGTVLGSFHVLSHLIFMTALSSQCHYFPHFTGKRRHRQVR